MNRHETDTDLIDFANHRILEQTLKTQEKSVTKQVTITVEAKSGHGKTAIAEVIRRALKEYNIEAKVHEPIEHDMRIDLTNDRFDFLKETQFDVNINIKNIPRNGIQQ